MNKPYIIAINAVSGGGKTTITRELSKVLSNSAALYFDDRDYDAESGIDDICKWVDEGSDANLFNLELLIADIEALISKDVDYILLDYPFGYRHEKVAQYIDISIFIDTPLDIALARRLTRDFKEENIKNVFDDLEFYLERGRDTYLISRKISMENADFVIDGSKIKNEIIEDIMSVIMRRANED